MAIVSSLQKTRGGASNTSTTSGVMERHEALQRKSALQYLARDAAALGLEVAPIGAPVQVYVAGVSEYARRYGYVLVAPTPARAKTAPEKKATRAKAARVAKSGRSDWQVAIVFLVAIVIITIATARPVQTVTYSEYQPAVVAVNQY